MEFSRPDYWIAYPFPSPGDLPNPGIEPRSPTLQAASLPAEPRKVQSRSVMSDSLQLHGLYSPWNSPGQNTGVGSLSLFQQIYPGTEPRSPALQADSLPAEPPGKHVTLAAR